MSKVDKKLAAIMFTDIVGYTQQMSKDEDKAFALIKKKRDLLLPLIEKHEGKLIKEIGDGTLTRYFKADNAIDCASRFQSKTDDDLNVRVGIHTGEVIIDNEDVFGDVVNVASRLESIAVPGSVLVSKETVDKLEMSKDFDLVSLGMQSLKGVGRLIEVFAIKEDSLVVPKSSDFKDTKVNIHDSDEVPAIAIIPFENKGADEDVFYAYGISADLISDCSSAGLIRVASLKDVEKLDFDNMDTSEISKKLLVRYIAQGTLWKMGEMFQLSIELFDAKDKKVVWSDRWQEKWDNLPTIKSKLSDGLLKVLNLDTVNKLKVEAYDADAYKFYLEAKYKHSKRKTKQDIEDVKKMLKKVLNIDDNLIEAILLLGVIQMQLGFPDKSKKYYLNALEKAKNNQDNLGYAKAMFRLGTIYAFKGDWIGAKPYFKKAFKIQRKIDDIKGVIDSLCGQGETFTMLGDFSKALKKYKKAKKIAIELDDEIILSDVLSGMGKLYYVFGKFKKSISLHKKALEVAKKFENTSLITHSLHGIATCHLQSHEVNEGIKVLDEILINSKRLGNTSDTAYTYGHISEAYAQKNDFKMAHLNIDKSLRLHEEVGIKDAIGGLYFGKGALYAYENKLDLSLEYFNRALKIFDDLRGESLPSVYTLAEIGKVYCLLKNYKKSLLFFEKCKSLMEKIGMSDGDYYFIVHLYLSFISKELDHNYKIENTDKYIDSINEFDEKVYLLLYDLTDNPSYLKSAYDKIQKMLSNTDEGLKNKFISYPIPKRILEEYKKL